MRDVLGVDDSKWAITICIADEIGGMVRVIVSEADLLHNQSADA